MTPSRAVVLAALVCLPVLAAAQPAGSGGAAVYRYAPVGSPTITVDVWGPVRQAGRYLVPSGISLVDLLALTGGPTVEGSGLAAATATVTVTRGPAGGRAVAVRRTLDDIAAGAAEAALEDGDLVVVRVAGAGRVAVAVNVWGAVGQPGRYEVVPGTDLLEVLTLAGGPRILTDNDRVARTATVSLSRLAGGARAVVFEGALEALAAGPIPVVEPGDLVTVRLEERQRFGWRDALSVAAASASLVLVVLRISDQAR